MIPRNINEVVTNILNIVPKTKEQFEFRFDLASFIQDNVTRAPEDTKPWRDLYDILIHYIEPPCKEEWEYKVWSVFSGNSIEVIKELVDE